MKHFTSVKDIPDLYQALDVAFDVKENPFGYQHLGHNKTMVLIFFNSSLRTRLSTQKAAMNLGMNTMVMNVNEDGWQLESELGVSNGWRQTGAPERSNSCNWFVLRYYWCTFFRKVSKQGN
jgi:ornithine carbamoyltransferase